ncbi:MAG: hypothetical protein ACK41Q_02855 [Candidatus Brocadia sp.]
MFSRLTGTIPTGLQLQLKALEYLSKCGVNTHPACMVSFSATENITTLRKRLKSINPVYEDLETEELILYQSVEERLKRLKVNYSV